MAKFKIEWSLEARLDLIDILDFYIELNGTNTYSIKLHSKIKRGIKLLSNNPYLGIPTEFDSIRAFVTGDYQVIYEMFDQLILVIMIWDCRRDPANKIIDQRKSH
jgi:plasmid stabilization system protein ParE